MAQLQEVVQLICCHQTVTKEVVSVAHECYDIADQTTLLCSSVQDKSIQNMIDTTQTISTEMRSIGDDNGNDQDIKKKLLDGKIFQKIKEMMDQSKTKQVLQFLEDINNDSKVLQEKAITMQQSIQRGIDNLPSSMKEQYGKDMVDDTMLDKAIHKSRNTAEGQGADRSIMTNDGNDGVDISSLVGQEENEMLQLLNIDDDVQELETTCQRGIMGDDDDDNNSGRKRLIDLDVFKNLLNGSIIYEKVQQKGTKCRSIVQQMRTLSGTITSLMQAFFSGGCCVQTMAILSNIGNLFRVRNIIQIFQKAIQTIQQMIRTLTQVIQKTFQHLQKVISELGAAKQIGQFVTNAVQHTKVGRLTSGVVSKVADSKVGDVCSNIVSNIFK